MQMNLPRNGRNIQLEVDGCKRRLKQRLGASIFYSLSLSLRNINFRVLFRKALDDFYL